MNRGSEPFAGMLGVLLYRFNEAPIHESGKSRLAQLEPTRRLPGFNEAPIHESGKWSL